MVALNLDKTTNRILCAYEIPSGNYANGTIFVDNLPNGVLYEYRYINGKYIHDPLPLASPIDEDKSSTFSVGSNDTDTKISELEEKINQLQKLVAKLSGET